MSSAAALYTGEVLALAAALSEYPITPDMPLHGEARSPACGSTLRLALALDARGAIARVGVSASACAVGQAAAAIFARAAPGHCAADIASAEAELVAWLSVQGRGTLPHWPGLAAIAAAAAFPARHGAILLAWRAGGMALSSGAAPG